jgi:hypothetical protein
MTSNILLSAVLFMLPGLLSKIREKRAYIDSAKDLIKRRYDEIEQVEETVARDVKTFAGKD